jgi:hypothetical protein
MNFNDFKAKHNLISGTSYSELEYENLLEEAKKELNEEDYFILEDHFYSASEEDYCSYEDYINGSISYVYKDYVKSGN